MPNRIGGHGIDGGLLDSGISNFSGARNRGRSGECQICQERCWTQDRLAGLPVVANPAHVWVVSRLVSAGGGDGGVTFLSATSADVDRIRCGAYSAHAESFDADESATEQCGIRYHWC